MIVHAPGGSHTVIPDLLPHYQPIDCLLTDPPYGADYVSTYGKNPEDRAKYQQAIDNDETPEQAILSFDQTMQAMAPFFADTMEMYVFSDWKVSPPWQIYLNALHETYGLRLMQLIIWEKGYPGLGDFTYNWGQGHEFIYYLKRGNRPVPYRRSGIIHVDKVRPGTNIHPTEKPRKLLKMLIEYSTEPSQFVFDPYSGSGSTVLSALECGRTALGIEKDAQYINPSRERLPGPSLFSL